MSSTYSKIVQGPKTVLIRSKQENIEFSVPSGHHVVLPEATDFSNCASSLNDVVSVDLSGKQDANAKLTQLSGLSGDENQVVAFNGDGDLVAINQASAPTYNAPLSVNGSNEVSFDDSGFLKSADLGVTVQGYDATTLKSADIGVSVHPYTENLLTEDAIGDTVQAHSASLDQFGGLGAVAWENSIPFYNGTAFALTDSNQIQLWGNMQERHNFLDQISNLTPSNNDVIKYDGNAQVWVSGTAPAPNNVVYTDQDSTISSTLTASNLVVSSYQQWKNAGQASFTDRRVFNNTASNDTEKSIAEYAMPNNQLLYIVNVVVSCFSSSGNYAQHELKGVVNNGSFVSGSYRQSDIFDDLTLTELKMDVSSSNLRVRVRSHASQNVRFHSVMEINAVEAISA